MGKFYFGGNEKKILFKWEQLENVLTGFWRTYSRITKIEKAKLLLKFNWD
jgi:hypothetical protein